MLASESSPWDHCSCCGCEQGLDEFLKDLPPLGSRGISDLSRFFINPSVKMPRNLGSFPQSRDCSLIKYAQLFYLDHPVYSQVPHFKSGRFQKSDLSVCLWVATIPRTGGIVHGGSARGLEGSSHPILSDDNLWKHLGLHPWLWSLVLLRALRGEYFSREPPGLHEAPPGWGQTQFTREVGWRWM